MSSGDIEKIFLLLKQFYPKHPFWDDGNRRYAYRLALEPYGYEQIKQAVIEHVRRTTAFPFVAELTGGQELAPAANGEAEREALYGMNDLERMERLLAKLQAK